MMAFLKNTIIAITSGILWLFFVAYVVEPFFHPLSEMPALMLFGGWLGIAWEYLKSLRGNNEH